MNKVEVVCICDGIRIADLGLSLSMGQRVEITEREASTSKDLERAHKVGGVRIRTVKGPQIVKDSKSRKDTSRMRATRAKKPRSLTPEEIFQQRMEALLSGQKSAFLALTEEMQAGISSSLQDSFSSSLQDALKAYTEALQNTQTPPPSIELDLSMIEKVVADAMKNAPVRSGGTFSPGSDDGPMFIPEGIVVDDAVADIGTSEDSSGFSVDEATEALRAMKKSKKSKKT